MVPAKRLPLAENLRLPQILYVLMEAFLVAKKRSAGAALLGVGFFLLSPGVLPREVPPFFFLDFLGAELRSKTPLPLPDFVCLAHLSSSSFFFDSSARHAPFFGGVFFDSPSESQDAQGSGGGPGCAHFSPACFFRAIFQSSLFRRNCSPVSCGSSSLWRGQALLKRCFGKNFLMSPSCVCLSLPFSLFLNASPLPLR